MFTFYKKYDHFSTFNRKRKIIYELIRMMIGSMTIGSAALRIATSVFLFSARIRFPAHNSIVGTL